MRSQGGGGTAIGCCGGVAISSAWDGGRVGRSAEPSSGFVQENEPRSRVGGEPEAAARAGGAIARRIGESDACRLARVAFDESPTFARCSRSEDTLYVRVVSEK